MAPPLAPEFMFVAVAVDDLGMKKSLIDEVRFALIYTTHKKYEPE